MKRIFLLNYLANRSLTAGHGPGTPATYQNLPESESSSRYTRSRDYQTPTRQLLGHRKRDSGFWFTAKWPLSS